LSSTVSSPLVIGIEKENTIGTEKENTIANPLKQDG
jgi:hypothetical protein